MKKLLLPFLIIAITLITACGDDDAAEVLEPGLNGTLTFDNTAYEIANGTISSRQLNAGTEVIFTLADGTINTNGGSSDSEILMSISAISEGTSTLESGTYETERIVTSMYAFVSVTTRSASNQRSVVGGTINISGGGNAYTLTLDVPFGAGVELTGTVTGIFED